MNRLYVKPIVNPAFKRWQALPPLAVAAKTLDNNSPGCPVPGPVRALVVTADQPLRGKPNSLCKNFASDNHL